MILIQVDESWCLKASHDFSSTVVDSIADIQKDININIEIEYDSSFSTSDNKTIFLQDLQISRYRKVQRTSLTTKGYNECEGFILLPDTSLSQPREVEACKAGRWAPLCQSCHVSCLL